MSLFLLMYSRRNSSQHGFCIHPVRRTHALRVCLATATAALLLTLCTLWCAGGVDHAVKLLDVKEQLVTATLSGHSKKVTALTFASEAVVVSGSADRTVRAWRKNPADASKWSLGYTYEAPATVVQVGTSSTRLHATGPIDKRPRLPDRLL